MSFQFHLGHRVAACMAFPVRWAASGALAGRDAVRRQSAVHFPGSFQEPVRDCLLVTVAQKQLGAWQAHQGLQPPDEQQVDRWMEPLGELHPDVAHRALLTAAQLETAVESVSLPEALPQPARQAQLALQPVGRRQAMGQEP